MPSDNTSALIERARKVYKEIYGDIISADDRVIFEDDSVILECVAKVAGFSNPSYREQATALEMRRCVFKAHYQEMNRLIDLALKKADARINVLNQLRSVSVEDPKPLGDEAC